ncbi:hypothetical protein LIER_35741 [Lithospermum erythrorhizon]|uniref:DUF4283 domain-containing protein n=1 Tax=Lithospermum erythrorhizon TaxID=34254 RepID=A0AAV3NX50_LITER
MNNSPSQSPPPTSLDRRGWIIQIDQEQAIANRTRLSRSLIGLIRDVEFFSADRVQAYVDSCWLLRGVVDVERRGSIYLCNFSVEEDMDDVISRSPLNINGALLILQHWTPNIVFSNFDISHTNIWVQIHGIPVEYFEESNVSRQIRVAGDIVVLDWNTTIYLFDPLVNQSNDNNSNEDQGHHYHSDDSSERINPHNNSPLYFEDSDETIGSSDDDNSGNSRGSRNQPNPVINPNTTINHTIQPPPPSNNTLNHNSANQNIHHPTPRRTTILQIVQLNPSRRPLHSHQKPQPFHQSKYQTHYKSQAHPHYHPPSQSQPIQHNQSNHQSQPFLKPLYKSYAQPPLYPQS